MSVLTDLIYGGSNAVAGLTEGAVNEAIAKYGAEKEIAFPDTAYFFPTIYAATGVKVKTLGDLPACVGVLKSLITNQEDLGQALNAGLATAVGAEILEGLKYAESSNPYENEAGIGFVPDPIIRSLGVPLVTGDIPGVAVVLGKAENPADVVSVVKDYQSKGIMTFMVGDSPIEGKYQPSSTSISHANGYAFLSPEFLIIMVFEKPSISSKISLALE